MQEVSQAWKNAHKQNLLPETFVKLNMVIGDTATMSKNEIDTYSPSPYSNDAEVFGDPNITVDTRYAYLERNTWVLDGSRTIVDDLDDYKSIGYAGELNKYGRVNIAADRGNTKDIPGITIVWDTENGAYPSSFRLTWSGFNGAGASILIEDNDSVISHVDFPIPKEYLDFTITGEHNYVGWNLPDRRPRIDRVFLGYNMAIDKDLLLSYSHEQTGDPLSTEVSTGKIEFVLDNTKTNWNMLNPSGIERYFFDQYPILVQYGMNVGGFTEWIKGGTFYLSEWEVSPDGLSSSFVAEDVFCFLRNNESSIQIMTATAKKDSVLYEDLEGTVTNEKILSGSTWVVTNIGMGLTTSGSARVSMLCIRIDGTHERWVTESSMTIDTSATIGDMAKRAYESVSISGDIKGEFNSSADSIPGPYLIEKTPVSEILQKCANIASCGLWQTRDGKLVMKPVSTALTDYTIPLFLAYSHPKIELAKPLKQVVLTQYSLYENVGNTYFTYTVGDSGETIQVDNSFLIAENTGVETLCRKIAAGWKNRTIVSGEFRADPRLDLFDMVTVESMYGEITPVVITSIKYSYNGSFRGTYTGRIIDVS